MQDPYASLADPFLAHYATLRGAVRWGASARLNRRMVAHTEWPAAGQRQAASGALMVSGVNARTSRVVPLQ